MDNKDILIMKQDKRHGVVIIDRNKYTEKCFTFIEFGSIQMFDKGPYIKQLKEKYKIYSEN